MPERGQENYKRMCEKKILIISEAVCWTEDTGLGQSITALGAEQNFYSDNDGNLVIVYSKYEVAPGYMGCPEIVIDKDDFEKYLILNFEPGQ